MEDQLDKIQIDFFETYNKIESQKLIIENIEGDKSRWSSNAMFNFTPLHIERSRGNLMVSEIHENKPDNSIITEAIYKKNKLVALKNWSNDELIGLSVFLYKQNKEVKEISVSIDENEQELRGITLFSLEKNEIVKKVEATIYGAFLENYIFLNEKIIKIEIFKRIDYINETIDTSDGITNVPINYFLYYIKYKDNKLSQILEENGKDILSR